MPATSRARRRLLGCALALTAATGAACVILAFLLGGCDGEALFQPASSKTLAGGRQGWPLVPEICGGAARQRR